MKILTKNISCIRIFPIFSIALHLLAKYQAELTNSFTILLCILYLSGCAMIPWQFSAVTNAVDVLLTAQTGKSSTEHVASEVTKLDCQWSRLLSDWKICVTHEEYVDNLMIMNCHTYSWNFLNIPYCRSPNEG